MRCSPMQSIKKWKSAEEFCKDHGMEFKVLTEDHLFPQYK